MRASDLELILASASPRRAALLRAIGLDPRPWPAAVDERRRPGESPRSLVLRLAESKGRRVLELLREREPGRAAWVLAADTEVALDGETLGKPADRDDAVRMLRHLRGRAHEVLTAVFLARTAGARTAGDVDVSRVFFRAYDDAAIRDYVASGEPLDKAGAYGIQGLGGRLVERVEGLWSTVVGLPVERLPEWAARIGLELGLPDGWRQAAWGDAAGA